MDPSSAQLLTGAELDYKDGLEAGFAITNPNARFLFGFLFVGWAVVFGVGLQLVPHQGASSPYGGFALIALFSGFFIMMGFLWAVIGE